jgi:hypothetical protein
MVEAAAGEVYFIPKEATLARDSKDRRCPLLADCEHDDAATLAYTSTKLTEAEGPAPALMVPVRARFGASPNGFDCDCFIYPGILTVIDVDQLDRKTGILNQREFDAVIAAIPRALGFGTGIDPQGLRGAVVEFGRFLKRRLSEAGIDAQHGVIISEQAYARRWKCYHTVVPLIPDTNPADDVEFVAEHPSWLSAVDREAASVLFAIRDTFSIYNNQIAMPRLRRWVSTTDLEQVEGALKRRFHIDETLARTKPETN